MARRRRSDRPLFPRGPGLGLRALMVAVLALAIWFADQRGFPLLTAVRGSMDWLLQPLRWASNLPGDVVEAASELKNYRALLSENAQLREDQLKMQARLLQIDALEAENRRIRQLMASSSALAQKVLIAEIVATSQDPYRHQITLNKGVRDGVYFGQAIVDAYGVMGQVIRVNPTSSTALLITDPSHGIPVEINRTGLQTIARGGGDGRVLTLPFLPGNADVKVGDLLVSSGLGGRFPAGYPVGEIFDVRKTTGEHFMEATAYPSARLNQGRQALLVWSDVPTPTVVEEAGESPAALAAAAARGHPSTPAVADNKPAKATASPVTAPVANPGSTAAKPKPATPAAAKPAHGDTAAKPAATPKPPPSAARPTSVQPTARPTVPKPAPASPAPAKTTASAPVTPSKPEDAKPAAPPADTTPAPAGASENHP